MFNSTTFPSDVLVEENG